MITNSSIESNCDYEKLERLRDEFAMAAPHEPQPWFEPLFPDFPKHPGQRPKTIDLSSGSYNVYTKEIAEYESALQKFSEEAKEWEKNRIKQRYIQWPYAWADEVLKTREQSK